MSYLDKYKNRLNRKGSNVGESFANNTIAFIEATFSDSPTFRVMEVLSSEFPEITSMDARVVEVERMGTLREVLFRPRQGLNIGSYVKFDNQTWLIYDQWGDKDGRKYVAIVQKCNDMLRWSIDENWKDDMGSLDLTKVKELSCIASQSPLSSKATQGKNDTEWNKYDVSLPLGQLFVFTEKNELSDSIVMNQRFILGRNVYEVFGIDDVSYVDEHGHGIVQFMIRLDVKRSADDFKNRIAFNSHKEETLEVSTVQKTEEDTDKGGNPW